MNTIESDGGKFISQLGQFIALSNSVMIVQRSKGMLGCVLRSEFKFECELLQLGQLCSVKLSRDCESDYEKNEST